MYIFSKNCMVLNTKGFHSVIPFQPSTSTANNRIYFVAVAIVMALGSSMPLVLQASPNHALNCPYGSLAIRFFTSNMLRLSWYGWRIAGNKKSWISIIIMLINKSVDFEGHTAIMRSAVKCIHSCAKYAKTLSLLCVKHLVLCTFLMPLELFCFVVVIT